MASALVQTLFSGNSKTAGTSLSITGSKSMTTGNDIFLAFASDDAGTSHSVAATGATVTWSLETTQTNTGNVVSRLWRGTITAGGTLTDITVSWTSNVTAKMASSAEFSGVGTQSATGGANAAGNSCADAANTLPANGLAVACLAFEDTNTGTFDPAASGTPSITDVIDLKNGTTGGGSASNITGALAHGIGVSSDSTGFQTVASSTLGAADNAGAGARYNPTAVAFFPPILPDAKGRYDPHVGY